MLRLATLNINGINDSMKQLQFIDFVKYHKIDVIFLQEHNIKDRSKINEIDKKFHVFINLSINLKGGTAILIDKRLPIDVINEEKSADSRLISLRIKLYNQIIHLVNTYAHSGKNANLDRENLFDTDLLYYLRNNLQNCIVAGDWNCVLSERDSTSKNTPISKKLLEIIRNLHLKDAWYIKNKNVEWTYRRQNHAARLDRIYLGSLSQHLKEIRNIPVTFSDHSCVYLDIEIPNMPKTGKYYWKMNTSLLKNENIRSKFIDEWENIRKSKSNFQNLNKWWDQYAKYKIKMFFIKMGKQENQKKYGLIQYLEHALHELYQRQNKSQIIDYDKEKFLKNRINELKLEILEGVKIRSRILDETEGEKVSAYLIGKQAKLKSKELITTIKAEKDIMNNVQPGTILNNKSSIELYVKNYYKKLYSKEECNENLKEWFLSHVTEKLTELDREILDEEIKDKEIFDAISSTKQGKSPGIDGLPIEFYLEYWNIIKIEICSIIKNVIDGLPLEEKQRKAIIVLIPKEGDLTVLKSWRPISLICSDTKIIAKILALRLKPHLDNVLSKNQYCVQGRSIIECNCKIRDMLFYVNEKNMNGAVINLDWNKAFDRVDWDFLIKIMKKIGFSNKIINWLAVLYSNIESLCLINGFLTEPFDVERGVRQGCPLSMLLYVLFQEPLYCAIEKCNLIIPIDIPGEKTNLLGYADDTTMFVQDDNSFLEVFRIINQFEKATNSILNISKTKLYGYGLWENRNNWPISNLKIEKDYFCTLGITFSYDYKLAVEKTWTDIIYKIKRRIQMLNNSEINLYQRAITINTLITSRLWYVAHTYPLPMKISDQINKEIFSFLWCKKRETIKRITLYNSKCAGGINVMNIYVKAKSILTHTTIKLFCKSNENSIIRYYLGKRINNLFNIVSYPKKIFYLSTPYYEFTVSEIRKCHQVKNFPNLNSKIIYRTLLPDIIIEKHKDFNWNNIWSNLNSKCINSNDRIICFKFLHEILPTKKRLAQMKIRNNPNCEVCNIEDNNRHMFYYCRKINLSLLFIKKLIRYLCEIPILNFINLLHLDLPKTNKKIRNTLCIILSTYTACIWYNRERPNYVLNAMKAKIIKDCRMKKKIFGDKFRTLFTEKYQGINMRILNQLSH